MWSQAPWGPKALAAVHAGESGPPQAPDPSGLGHQMVHLAGLGLSLQAPMPSLLVATQLGWHLYAAPMTAWRPPDSIWPVGDAPDMGDLQAAAQRDDYYGHTQSLITLAEAHLLRGEVEAAKTQLAGVLGQLRRTPDIEFDARAWDAAQRLCLQLGDFPAALALVQDRPNGALDALDEFVGFAFEFDHVDQLIAAAPVLFALSPGDEDVLPDPPAGCADAMHPLRGATLADWSERLIADGYVKLHRSLLQATPDVAMREALRALAVRGLLLEERHDEAWAVFAQMGLEPSDVKLGMCAGIEAPGGLRSASRLEILEVALDTEQLSVVLKAIESALITGEVAEISWDLVGSAAEARGETAALAAIVGKARGNTTQIRRAQVEWAETMLIAANPQSVYAARATLKPLAFDADLVVEFDEAIKGADADLADSALPTDDVVLPEERLVGELELAQLYFERGDRGRARTAIRAAWWGLEILAEGEVAAGYWPTWARLSLLLGEGRAAIKKAAGLPTAATRLTALQALGDAALEVRQAEMNVAIARAVVRTAEASAKGAAKAGGDAKVAGCPSPSDALAERALEPWLTGWADRLRFDVAVQIARQLPAGVRGRRLAALVVQMAAGGRLEAAFHRAPEVSVNAPGCSAGPEDARDLAWLGLIDHALKHDRFTIARRALIAMPHLPTDMARFAEVTHRLFDRLAEAEQMPDLSPVLNRPDAPAPVRAVIQREVIRQHLAQGRVGAALAVGKQSDRRTRMLLLLALAREPDERLAAHASAIRALDQGDDTPL